MVTEQSYGDDICDKVRQLDAKYPTSSPGSGNAEGPGDEVAKYQFCQCAYKSSKFEPFRLSTGRVYSILKKAFARSGFVLPLTI